MSERMVLVPIELVRWAREMKLNYAADADSVSDSEACHRDADRLQACLDAEPVRVVGVGDVVIPAVVAGRATACWSKITLQTDGLKTDGSTDFLAKMAGSSLAEINAYGTTQQAAMDALAAALGVSHAKVSDLIEFESKLATCDKCGAWDVSQGHFPCTRAALTAKENHGN